MCTDDSIPGARCQISRRDGFRRNGFQERINAGGKIEPKTGCRTGIARTDGIIGSRAFGTVGQLAEGQLIPARWTAKRYCGKGIKTRQAPRPVFYCAAEPLRGQRDSCPATCCRAR